jgi:chromosome segregation ATPase
MIEDELESLIKLLSEHTTTQTALSARRSERQSQVDDLQKSLQAIDSEIERLQDKVQVTESFSEEMHSKLLNAEQLKIEKETYIEQIQSRLTAMEEILREQGNQLNQLHADLTRNQAQSEVIEQAEQTLSGYASGARLLIQAAREARVKGARAALSGQIQVSEKYETAIAAALGEYLDAILFEDNDALETALVELEGKHARGALIPLTSLKHEAGALAIQPSADVVGLASDFVTAPPEIRPVIDLLLGRTVLVTDRSAARRVLGWITENLQSAIIKVITVRGEVFYPSGSVLVAQEGKSSTLSRSRQKRELEAEITKIRSSIDLLSKSFDENQISLQVLLQEKLKENEIFQNLIKAKIVPGIFRTIGGLTRKHQINGNGTRNTVKESNRKKPGSPFSQKLISALIVAEIRTN